MILLLDMGNTFLKWAWLDSGKLSAGGEVLHVGSQLAGSLDEAWQSLPSPEQVWVGNVAGDTRATELDKWLHERWNVSAHYALTTDECCGIQNAYTEPGQLGVDRWLSLIAAYDLIQSATCVIDCGTAITVDALAASGQHLGGLIIPGLGMMRESLYSGADGVAEEAVAEPPEGMLACDTVGAVEAGTLYSIVAFIDRVTADLRKQLDEPMICLLTGGDAPAILPLLAVDVQHHPQLVLQGLARLAEHV